MGLSKPWPWTVDRGLVNRGFFPWTWTPMGNGRWPWMPAGDSKPWTAIVDSAPTIAIC